MANSSGDSVQLSRQHAEIRLKANCNQKQHCAYVHACWLRVAMPLTMSPGQGLLPWLPLASGSTHTHKAGRCAG
jgi:hypothetical protein